MGGCVSSRISGSDNDEKLSLSAANVITINGQLRQFLIPITVSQALRQIESESKSLSSSSFICNSDSLYYDEPIPALDSVDELQSGQIYFILPNSKLHYLLSASDMAALAVKASAALSVNNNGRGSKSRISPVFPMESVNREQRISVLYSSNSSTVGLMKMKKSYSSDHKQAGPMRKLQRYSSRRTKLAVRSFRLRLTTIYEGSDLQFY